MVKARVAEFQAQSILEVDPAAHRIGSLAIGKLIAQTASP